MTIPRKILTGLFVVFFALASIMAISESEVYSDREHDAERRTVNLAQWWAFLGIEYTGLFSYSRLSGRMP
jgi:hypothetical protein